MRYTLRHLFGIVATFQAAMLFMALVFTVQGPSTFGDAFVCAWIAALVVMAFYLLSGRSGPLLVRCIETEYIDGNGQRTRHVRRIEV